MINELVSKIKIAFLEKTKFVYTFVDQKIAKFIVDQKQRKIVTISILSLALVYATVLILALIALPFRTNKNSNGFIVNKPEISQGQSRSVEIKTINSENLKSIRAKINQITIPDKNLQIPDIIKTR